jgi:AcrR family transcriptional regulator
MTTASKQTSRDKILAAAGDLAREIGPGHLSLDAVARRAGVSKGGLLYNFPNKASLMQGLVEDYIDVFEHDLDLATRDGKRGRQLFEAYVTLSEKECAEAGGQASGIVAALAENPDFLRPIKAFKRRLLDRLKVGTDDLPKLLVAYLALEGLRSLAAFDLDVLTVEERELVMAALSSSAGSPS